MNQTTDFINYLSLSLSLFLATDLCLISCSASRKVDIVTNEFLRHVSAQFSDDCEGFSCSCGANAQDVVLVTEEKSNHFRIADVVYSRYFYICFIIIIIIKCGRGGVVFTRIFHVNSNFVFFSVFHPAVPSGRGWFSIQCYISEASIMKS